MGDTRIKNEVLFILDQDFAVDRCEPLTSLCCSDRVHLNPTGMSVWLRKVTTFLELLPLSTQPVYQRAADHNHQPDERAGVRRVNRQRAFIKENLPTASSIPVVNGNRAAVHSLRADDSSNVKPAAQQPAASGHCPGRNAVYPMPFLRPMLPFPPHRPTLWPNPFSHCYPRPQLESFERVY